MARCGCAGTSCSCVIRGSGPITVTGAGSVNNPYTIGGGGILLVNDSSTVDMVLTGSGSTTEPYLLSANAAVSLDELTDVSTAGGATGKVLAQQSDGTYALVPPVTASAGALNVGNGLQGDASSGSPLAVKLAPSSGLISDSTGLRSTGAASWSIYTPVLTASGTNPVLGNGGIAGRYMVLGKTVHLAVQILIGSTTQRGTGGWHVSLPPGLTNVVNMIYVTSMQMYSAGVADYIGVGVIDSDLTFRYNGVDRALSVTHSQPASLAAGSRISATGIYEVV